MMPECHRMLKYINKLDYHMNDTYVNGLKESKLCLYISTIIYFIHFNNIDPYCFTLIKEQKMDLNLVNFVALINNNVMN